MHRIVYIAILQVFLYRALSQKILLSVIPYQEVSFDWFPKKPQHCDKVIRFGVICFWFTHEKLSTAQRCFLPSNNENGGFVCGPSYRPASKVLGHKRVRSIPQNKQRFITIFYCQITYKACVLIFRSQIILKELCFTLEKEVFCTPCFSLKCRQSSEAKKELGILNTDGLSQNSQF